MTTFTWYADGGSNGATIATSDTGSGTAFTAVQDGSGTTCTYSNTGGCLRPSHALCMKYTTGGTSASVSRRWGSAIINTGNTAATQYHRLYLDPADFAAGNVVLARGTDSTTGNQRWRLIKDSSSRVVLQDSASAAVFTSTAITGRTRVEWEVAGANGGACRLRWFAGDSTTAGYDSGAGTGSFAGTIQAISWGQATSGANITGKITDLGWSDTAALGPSVVSGSGALTDAVTLSGTPKVVVNSSGSFAATAMITGTPKAVIHGNGSLGAVVTLGGAPKVIAYASGSLPVTTVLTGTPTVVVRAAGSFVVDTTLPGAATSVVHAAGTFPVSVSLAGEPVGVAVAAGTFAPSVTLAGAGVREAVAGGAFDYTVTLAGEPEQHQVIEASGAFVITVSATMSPIVVRHARRRSTSPAGARDGGITHRRGS